MCVAQCVRLSPCVHEADARRPHLSSWSWEEPSRVPIRILECGHQSHWAHFLRQSTVFWESSKTIRPAPYTHMRGKGEAELLRTGSPTLPKRQMRIHGWLALQSHPWHNTQFHMLMNTYICQQRDQLNSKTPQESQGL